MNEKKHNSKIDGSGFKTENAKKTAEQSEHECPSFSAGVKKEISEQKIKREADAHALLSAFTLSIGALKKTICLQGLSEICRSGGMFGRGNSQLSASEVP